MRLVVSLREFCAYSAHGKKWFHCAGYPDSRTGDISQSPESSTLSGNLSGDDILIEIYFGLL